MDSTVVYKSQNDTLPLTGQKKSKMHPLKMKLLQYSSRHKKQWFSDPPYKSFFLKVVIKKCNNEIVLYEEGKASLDVS